MRWLTLTVVPLLLFLAGPAHAQYNSFPPGVFSGNAAQTPAGGGGGTVTLDVATPASVAGSAGTTLTWSQAGAASGLTAAEVQASVYGAGGTLPSATYGGTSMTLVASWTGSQASLGGTDAVWCLLAPAGGTQTVVVTAGGEGASGYYIAAQSVTVTGSNTSTCMRAGSSASSINAAETSPQAATMSTQSGDLQVDMFACLSCTAPGPSNTALYATQTIAAANFRGSYKSATGSSTATSWTFSGTPSNNAVFGAAFQHP